VKQVLQSYRTGELTVADVPAPRASPGTVLVHTRASLVSAGTERMVMALAKKSLAGKAMDRPDLVKKVTDKLSKDGVVATAKAVLNRLDQPIPLGYSAAGVVVDRGTGAEAFAVGARVACAGAKVANHAEFNAVPLNLCVAVPDGVTDEAASFVTVGAIALQGVRTAQLTLGERVGVIGLGLIGQLAAQLARADGCRVLGIDLDPSKVELARTLGVDAVQRDGNVDEEVRRLTDGRGLDAVIICAAADTNDPVELAGELSRDRGRVVVVGAVQMDVPRRPYYDKELSLLQSRAYGPGRYDPSYEEQGVDYPFGYVRWTEGRNMQAFLELCATGQVRVEPLVTHRIPISQGERAYRLISGETAEHFLGVVLTYPESAEPVRTVSLLPTPPSAPTPSLPRVSVIGAGAFASGVLVPELSRVRGIRKQTIVSARGTSALHLAKKFEFVSASTDADTALTQDAEAVVICTRHDLHASQAARALRAGKAVFLEKPLAIDRKGLDEVVVAARGSDRAFLVDFNRRFAPLAVQMREFFAGRSQPLVIHYRVNAGTIPSDSWIHDPRVGGGRVIGEACHFIDFCQALTGAPLARVQADSVAGASGGFRNDDQVALTLSFADGSLATLLYTSGGDAALPKERVEAHCGGTSAVLDDFKALELVRGGKTKRSRSFTKDKGHFAALEAFFDAVRRGAPAPVPLRSLVETTLATFAAVEAMGSGRAVELGPWVREVLSDA
jgi:predicted dehydrogenase